MPSAHPDPPPEPHPGELVMEVARALRRRFASTLEPWGITPHEARALRVVGHHEPTRLGVVASHLRIAPRSVTDVVDALEGHGFVAREPDPSDRRATRVALTPEGRRVLDELDAARRADSEDYFAGLSDRDRATLTRILARLVDDGRAPRG
ncbi:MarR family transcriptional regulator [Rothia sp. ARF10]|nr:MarR family transcriptional regulator [Rothia sp. ARF10]